MCIIVAKPAGVKIPLQILKNCFDSNPDGAGMAFQLPSKDVFIRKGFMEFQDMKNSLRDLGKRMDLTDSNIIMHFRVTTHGLSDKGNCHPFPIEGLDYARKLSFITSTAVAHNGVITGYGGFNQIYSDTQVFINKILTPLVAKHPGIYRDPEFLDMLRKSTNSKFAFLDNKGLSITDGFTEDDGLFLSNTSYLFNDDRWVEEFYAKQYELYENKTNTNSKIPIYRKFPIKRGV